MAIGLSTYAFFWQHSDRAPEPLTVVGMIERTGDLGAGVFQICDYPRVEAMSAGDLKDVRAAAEAHGVRLELGTRGVRPDHLRRYLDLATTVGAAFVRTMLNTADDRPTIPEAVAALADAVPAYAGRGVTLGLETYEQVATADLVRVVEDVGSPRLGVCLDPGNCVARLEMPADVVRRVAPYVVNMHVKDFRFTRQAGWVGFSLAGCPLGEGLLDYDGMVAAVQPEAKGISQVVEHWLPWQDDFERTRRLEQEWTRRTLDTLRSKA